MFLPGANLNLFLALLIIDMILRGMGMWRAARHNQTGWFIVMLVINSLGLLPLVYLALFQQPMHPKTHSKKR